MLTAKAEDFHAPRLFYVFVNLNADRGWPEYFIVQSSTVADYVKKDHAHWLKTPGAKGQPHNNSSVRKFKVTDDRFLDAWHLLGL